MVGGGVKGCGVVSGRLILEMPTVGDVKIVGG